MTIPASAQRVVVLEQFAHLDWDWLNFFPYNVDESGMACNSGYFGPSWVKPAATIYRMAGNLLRAERSEDEKAATRRLSQNAGGPRSFDFCRVVTSRCRNATPLVQDAVDGVALPEHGHQMLRSQPPRTSHTVRKRLPAEATSMSTVKSLFGISGRGASSRPAAKA